MKYEKLNEALGMLPDALTETDAAVTTAPRRRIRGKILLAAALCAGILVMTAAAAVMRYLYAPGVGIVGAGEIQVYACYEEIFVGNARIDAAVLSRTGDFCHVALYVWRDEEVQQDPAQAMQGIPPAELDNVALIVNGREQIRRGASMSTHGFSSYRYEGVPFAEEMTLRDHAGNETVIRFTDVRESDYAQMRGFVLPGGGKLGVIPVTGTGNLFAAELREPISEKIAENAERTSAMAHLSAHCTDGTEGSVSGTVQFEDGSGCLQIAHKAYGKEVEALSLRGVSITHIFNPGWSDTPEVKFTIPAPGESVAVDLVIYDANGITCRVTEITREIGQGLTYKVDVESKHAHLTSFSVMAQAYVRMDVDYMNGQMHIQQENSPVILTNSAQGYDTRDVYITNLNTGETRVAEAGEEAYLSIQVMRYGIEGSGKVQVK
ncbi:MAG: hypothetical protein E7662_03665 [Ruminococcaceae bacterium]|nr:hypothetical protein [Oscillospiraceae bacterium]